MKEKPGNTTLLLKENPDQNIPAPLAVKIVRDNIRLHQLDGLRAIASILVVLHHLGAAALAESLLRNHHVVLGRFIHTGTAAGVEMFFVLSGIVLLRPYLRAGRPLVIHQYFRRRFLRLWPPYAVAWVLSGAMVATVTAMPTWWTDTSNLPSFSYSSWLSQIGIVYFGHESMNFAWWSLTVEVMFYLLLPLVILCIRPFHPGSFLITLLLLGSCLFSAGIAQVKMEVNIVGFHSLRSLMLYSSCFVGGIIMAWRDMPARWMRICLAAGTMYMIAALFVPQLNVHVGWGLFFTGLIGVTLEPGFLQRALASRTLVWLGERSYSWFLTHYAVIGLVCWGMSRLVESKGFYYLLATRALSLPLSLFVAMLLFWFVEKRFASGLTTADQFWPWAQKTAGNK